MSGLEAIALSTEARQVELIDPRSGLALRDKSGKAAFIEILPPHAKEADEIKRSLYEARNRKGFRQRGNGQMTYDEAQARGAELLTGLSVSWYLVGFDGEPIDAPFSKEAARRLYIDPKMSWITDQINEALGDEAAFIKA